jgi:acyl-CoA thioesterase I
MISTSMHEYFSADLDRVCSGPYCGCPVLGSACESPMHEASIAAEPKWHSEQGGECVSAATARSMMFHEIRRSLRLALALAAVTLPAWLLQAPGARAADRLPCAAPQAISHLDAPLAGFARTVERSRDIRIVAIGSSSTEGAGASSKQKAFPARFDQELDLRFPGKDFQVDNLGKGGELAEAMVARMKRDVIPTRPALVVWQTGVNDAIHGVDIAAFQATMEAGVAALKAADIEVVLIDQQFYPRAATVPRYEDYIAVMHKVAKAHHVAVFKRYAIMQHLISSGQHSVDALLWQDKFHLNDFSYGCLAELMAKAVFERVQRREPTEIAAQSASVRPQRNIDNWSTPF